MKKDKKIVTKEGRLSGPFKDSMVETLSREALVANPSLTKGQLRRIFSHCYQALRKDKGDDTFKNAWKAAITKYVPEEFTTKPIKKGKDNGRAKSKEGNKRRKIS